MLPSLNFPQFDFVKPSSGFHPVTWERVIYGGANWDGGGQRGYREKDRISDE